MPKKNMAAFVFSAADKHVIVALHGKKSPSAGEWSQYITLAREHYRTHPRIILAGVTATLGGAPDSKQRKQLIEASSTESLASPGAVISDSPMIRGIITAFLWMRKNNLRAFAPNAFREGLTHVGLPETEFVRFLTQAQAASASVADDPVAEVLKSNPH